MFVRIAFRDARFFTGITLINLYLRFYTLYFEFNYVFCYFNCVITQVRLLSIALRPLCNEKFLEKSCSIHPNWILHQLVFPKSSISAISLSHCNKTYVCFFLTLIVVNVTNNEKHYKYFKRIREKLKHYNIKSACSY